MTPTQNLQNERFWLVNMVCSSKFREDFWLNLPVVVVEKPFTVDTAEADRLIAVAKKSGKILTVFQSMPLLPPRETVCS